MKKLLLIIIFVLIVLYAFPQQGTTLLHWEKYSVNDSLNEKYDQILKGLNLNYVLWYTRYDRSHKERFRRISYSEFLQDSITYWKCYNDFFSEDLQIVFWLLNFKKDDSKEDLIWQNTKDPMSSYLGECDMHLTNSRSAIILVENYLEGKGFKCYECYGSKSCKRKKYRKVEKFLKTNQNKTVEEIRLEWKKKNAH
jgi:hypothetical protein